MVPPLGLATPVIFFTHILWFRSLLQWTICVSFVIVLDGGECNNHQICVVSSIVCVYDTLGVSFLSRTASSTYLPNNNPLSQTKSEHGSVRLHKLSYYSGEKM